MNLLIQEPDLLRMVLKWTVDRQLVMSMTETSRDKAALIAHLLEDRLADYRIIPTLRPRDANDE